MTNAQYEQFDTSHRSLRGWNRFSWKDAEDKVSLEFSKTPVNAWSPFDMIGNVEEWVSNWFGPHGPER